MMTTSQLVDTTPSTILFDVGVFLLPSLVNGPNFMQIPKLVLRMTILIYTGFDQKSRYQKYPPLNFVQYLETKTRNDSKFGNNASNEKLLKAAKYQVYNFYHFWVIKGKPAKGVKITPTTQIRGKNSHELYFHPLIIKFFLFV